MVYYVQIVGYICDSLNPDCVAANIIHHQTLVETLVKFLVKILVSN